MVARLIFNQVRVGSTPTSLAKWRYMEIDVVKMMQTLHDCGVSPEVSGEIMFDLGFSLEEMLAHLNDVKCGDDCLACLRASKYFSAD